MIPPNTPISDKCKLRCIELYLSGATYFEITNELGISSASVGKIVKGAGHLKGKKVISPEIKLEAVKLYQSGLTAKEVADKMGISISALLRWTKDAGYKPRGRSYGLVKWRSGGGKPKPEDNHNFGKPLPQETRIKISNTLGPKVPTTCAHCNVEIMIRPSRLVPGVNRFCSRKCKDRYHASAMKGENAPNWKGGIAYLPYCTLFNPEFRERVREFWGRKCALCGKQESDLKRRLSVHHVHGIKESCCDEKLPRDFVPLCGSCHGKVGTDNPDLQLYYQELFLTLINEKGGRCYLPKSDPQ